MRTEPSVKIDLEKIISDGGPLIIELGCGKDVRGAAILVRHPQWFYSALYRRFEY